MTTENATYVLDQQVRIANSAYLGTVTELKMAGNLPLFRVTLHGHRPGTGAWYGASELEPVAADLVSADCTMREHLVCKTDGCRCRCHPRNAAALVADVNAELGEIEQRHPEIWPANAAGVVQTVDGEAELKPGGHSFAFISSAAEPAWTAYPQYHDHGPGRFCGPECKPVDVAAIDVDAEVNELAELAALVALRDRLRAAEGRANRALDMLAAREEELAAARDALRRAEARSQQFCEREDQAAADYRASLELLGYVDTATGPVKAGLADHDPAGCGCGAHNGGPGNVLPYGKHSGPPAPGESAHVGHVSCSPDGCVIR